MKLPRYLQVALAVTAGLVLWSHFSDDSEERLDPVTQRLEVKTPVARPVTTAADSNARANLFPLPKSMTDAANKAQSVVINLPPPVTKTPPLPLQVMGAWWSQNQRIIIITDGLNTWPVCDKCRAEGKIWLGSTPVSGWTLTDVQDDHLQFEWQATHVRQQLTLGDLASESKH